MLEVHVTLTQYGKFTELNVKLQNLTTLRKKAGPNDQHMRVIGLHLKRPA